ncbi:MAG: DNA internalization-related competence protein ComEC/Rec2 [Lysobacter sp.]|nr:MAG: DNA internalization-related competence protein ComEC/Rec2 [Lysobacter sp.]
MLTPAFAIVLLAGMLACLWLPVLPPWWLWAWLGAGLVGAILWRARMARRDNAESLIDRSNGRSLGQPIRLLCVAALGFAWAAVHASWTMSLRLPASMERGEFALRGTVVDLPAHEARRTRFDLIVDDDASQPEALRGKRLRLAWYDDYDLPPLSAGSTTIDVAQRPRFRLQTGARWALTAKLRAPRGLRNPGGVDSERYAAIDRIAATGYVRDPMRARSLAAPRGLDAWRARMSGRIAAATPDAGGRFVRALALGDTRGLRDEDWATLRTAGLTHLIAISGFHVGLVAGFFALLARACWWCWPTLGRRWPRAQAMAVAAMFGASLYAAVTGFSVPTLRTAAMIAVVAVARASRRRGRAADALALSAVGLAALDPLSLLAAGFWLSFAGVAWLLWCMPAPSRRPVREFLTAQRVATIGLLPLSAAFFGQVSSIGPLANLFAIPWWSLVVVPLALIGVACDAVAPGAGEGAWRAAALAFEPSWALVSRLAAEPAALWWLPEAAWFALPLALCAAFWSLMPAGVPGRALALLLWLPLLWPDRARPEPGEAEIVMIDVGQGLSVLVRTARHNLLYDMGPAVEEGFDAGERAATPSLRALGVRALDAAVLSHGDNDHAGGFEAVEAAFPIARRYAPADSGLSARVRRLRDCQAGLAWEWDGVRFRFLHPTAHFPYLRNESSCVLRIETAHGAALLTGDIGEVIERDLLRRAPEDVRVEVLTVAHHGSAGSSDSGFVAATGARFALVSTGDGNRFGHPRAEIVERWRRHGAAVPVTARTGALRVRLGASGAALVAERERRPHWWDAAARRE